MKLRPGQKLNSAVCGAQFIVLKAPAIPVDLVCGGVPLVEEGQAAASPAVLDLDAGEAPMLGKRYADDDIGLEVLHTCRHGRPHRRRPDPAREGRQAVALLRLNPPS